MRFFVLILMLVLPLSVSAQDSANEEEFIVEAPASAPVPETVPEENAQEPESSGAQSTEKDDTATETAEGTIVPNDPYTIANVVVDVTADNAVEARAEAFAKGAEMAVMQFLKAQGAPEELNGVKPDSLVRDFQVNEEHFSRTRYKAILTYRFRPSAMGRLVNASVPAENALPVVDEEVDPTDTDNAPEDLDQPWNPTKPMPAPIEEGGRSSPPAPATAPAMNTWTLTVGFDETAQWLVAQDMIIARPEIRGLKMETMGGNQARLTITTEESPAMIQNKWRSLGWNVNGAGTGLTLDARTVGR